MKCPKCEAKNKEGAKFCSDCGAKLTEQKKKFKSHFLFIGSIIVVVLILFILFVPTKTLTYEVEVSYKDTETYTDKEPYETQEAYQVQEPYQTTETYTDTVPVQKEVPYENLEYFFETVEKEDCNTDADCSCTERGGFLWLTCIKCECKKSHYVTRYRTTTVQEEIEKERPVTKYKTVTKYRTVEKYRDVEKTRDVMKTKKETREKEVNWIWGFKMPYKLHLPLISKS